MGVRRPGHREKELDPSDGTGAGQQHPTRAPEPEVRGVLSFIDSSILEQVEEDEDGGIDVGG